MNTPNGASNNSGNYMNAPLYMSMNMHMFGVICAPRNNYTNAYVRINGNGMMQHRMEMSRREISNKFLWNF
tara:strand:+ start:238 stop:450 length:213 start_codon:yes stop_codon:yes gene_type:complete